MKMNFRNFRPNNNLITILKNMENASSKHCKQNGSVQAFHTIHLPVKKVQGLDLSVSLLASMEVDRLTDVDECILHIL